MPNRVKLEGERFSKYLDFAIPHKHVSPTTMYTKGSGGWTAPKEANVPADAPKTQLYDLEKDRGETTNLYTTQPEVVERLLKQREADVMGGRSTDGLASKNDAEVDLWKLNPAKRGRTPKKRAKE